MGTDTDGATELENGRVCGDEAARHIQRSRRRTPPLITMSPAPPWHCVHDRPRQGCALQVPVRQPIAPSDGLPLDVKNKARCTGG